ncbi:c-type cytochrome [Psychrobacter pygoscelis]|uniref:c-type cytochrome n=1 Tax=Psychrobacter pygoscelis TaxID=2488563 RepID=UPI00103DF5FC|nr:cytochrome c [Psychrobacter pygoscelis]
MSFFTDLLSNNTSKKSLALPLVISAALLSACNGAPSNPDVKARQDMMKNWGDAMGVMGDMVKAPDTFDPEVFKEQAAFLANDAKNPWPHFEDESAVGHATKAVWSDADGFRSESENLQKVASELNAAAQNATSVADVEAEFKAVGGSCKSCHTDYKVKDD